MIIHENSTELYWIKFLSVSLLDKTDRFQDRFYYLIVHYSTLV